MQEKAALGTCVTPLIWELSFRTSVHDVAEDGRCHKAADIKKNDTNVRSQCTTEHYM